MFTCYLDTITFSLEDNAEKLATSKHYKVDTFLVQRFGKYLLQICSKTKRKLLILNDT